ncbi:hypothetical protein [Paenibacillus sp. MBLB4367]|uniref:hypothetical protein n=1 Tax=Paenibacillus sp. MBLB4367 TaxID=3384767 RepID=UPI003908386A
MDLRNVLTEEERQALLGGAGGEGKAEASAQGAVLPASAEQSASVPNEMAELTNTINRLLVTVEELKHRIMDMEWRLTQAERRSQEYADLLMPPMPMPMHLSSAELAYPAPQLEDLTLSVEAAAAKEKEVPQENLPLSRVTTYGNRKPPSLVEKLFKRNDGPAN